MLLSFPVQPPPNKNNLPRRTTSLVASKAPIFTEIEDELRDVKRVHSQGQEEDLRMALSKMISRVEELSTLLKEAYKVQTDLQTELTVAKSNLQLALANNEMLEDALNREVPGSSKDVGWRRYGAKEQKEREESASRRQSSDSIRTSVEAPSPSPSVTSPIPSSDGRFFRFRFGRSSTQDSVSSATSTHFPPSPRIPGHMSPSVPVGNSNGSLSASASHLTSASLPSLIQTQKEKEKEKEKEVAELSAELEKQKKALRDAQAAKESLEAELESLSQALFEEANKMVATERRKLAETMDELREAQEEKEALRSALRLVESQHASPQSTFAPDSHFQSNTNFDPNAVSSKIRPQSLSSPPRRNSSSGTRPRSQSHIEAIDLSGHSRQFSASSARAIKSPVSSRSSSPGGSSSTHESSSYSHGQHEPQTECNVENGDEEDSNETDEIRSPAQPKSAASTKTITPAHPSFGSALADLLASPSSDYKLSSEQGSGQEEDGDADTTMTMKSPSVSTNPTPSPNPSPGLTSLASRPVMYFEEDSMSPWADVKSPIPKVES